MPEWADPRELDPEVRRDLRGLSKEGSEFVAGHLFMAGMLAEEDPALAWRHARAARSKGGRIAVVRETVGLVAYRAGEWAEAIAELRAARRMSGGPGQLPVMADCERALGHPEKAIELSRSAEAAELDPSSAAELTIVVAGARADMGQLDAALANLESAVQTTEVEPYTARLFYAYADLLLQADRRDEAIEYFMKAADLDVDEETDAGDRLTELADEDADLSGTEATDFVADDDLTGDADDDDESLVAGRESMGRPDRASADEASSDDASSDDAASGDATSEDASSDEVEGAFRSDPAEQEKLLMTDDDDDDEPSIGAAHREVAAPTDTQSPEPEQSPDAGLSAAQSNQLDLDDERAQASTEISGPDGSSPTAQPEEATQQADPPPRPVVDPPVTGSLFSHHEGGL